MNGFTPAQVEALKGWAEQRDALLRDIGVLSSEKEELTKNKTESGLALADLHTSISEARGRLAELNALEERHRTSVAIDVSELEVRKSRLQAECVDQENSLNASKREQSVVIGTTAALIDANKTIGDQAQIVESVVGGLIETSKVALSDTKGLFEDIRAMATQVIDKGTENVKQTNIILEKLPKYIFELQRPIPVRRHYPAGHPNAPTVDDTNVGTS